MQRKGKVEYYLDIATSVLERGTCLRRNYGAILVQNDEIIATGYTGAPRGRVNCNESGSCLRRDLNIQSGSNYELCRSVHAEANCIISASRDRMIGSTLYVAGKCMETHQLLTEVEPCLMCKRLIINAGVETVIAGTSTIHTITDVRNQWVYIDESFEGVINDG